ncbi:hypothetical protein THAOC_14155 [Thalassiosira oceanica]|uniref:Uncharacterized protein n=1 Tax=Thalassiosira oceanica TaxID=159749 RepID=K0SVM6_THAOC|nr:hypothetical protein THAOC_14155 [Thalassiosira oceanica]|eukprot:EJK65046.1 hypothetical protein THAOC_14155 [Thalassiosira oceanica]
MVLAAANVVFPRIARRRGTQVHSSFRWATGYGPPKPWGKHQYLGTNARPVHQQTALRLVHGVYGYPLLVQKIKILKMDEDGAPSHLPSDCGEGDDNASCAVRTASRRPHGGPRRDSQNSRGNATSSAGARRSIRSRTRSADSSTGRSTVGCSGGSGSIGGSGAGARAPGGVLPKDVPGRATSAMTVTRAHPRANARD